MSTLPPLFFSLEFFFVSCILPLSHQQRPLALLGLAEAPRELGYQGKQDNGNNCASNLAPCLSGAGNRSHRDNVGPYKGMAIGEKSVRLLFFSLIGPRSCLRSQCGAAAKSGASRPGSIKEILTSPWHSVFRWSTGAKQSAVGTDRYHNSYALPLKRFNIVHLIFIAHC